MLAAACLFLTSCSFRMTSPGSFPDAVRIHEVVPYRQEARLCGPYALASVLDYLGVTADPEEIAGRIYSPGAGGTLTLDLYLEAVRRGVDARQISGTVAGLHHEVENEAPVILLLKYPGTGGTPGHYVVVTGSSRDPSGFFLLWGDGRLSWMEERRLEAFWSGSGFWALTFDGRGRS
jgi:hypothetical protein